MRIHICDNKKLSNFKKLIVNQWYTFEELKYEY